MVLAAALLAVELSALERTETALAEVETPGVTVTVSIVMIGLEKALATWELCYSSVYLHDLGRLPLIQFFIREHNSAQER